MLHRWVLVGTLVVAMVVTPVAGTAREETNEAPLADAGLDQRVELGTTVLLDATGSRDPDGEIETYEWRIETPDGGTIVPQCPTCGRSTFRPTMAGTYAVTITVIDDDGLRSSDTLYVTVDGPTTSPEAPETPDTGPSASPPGAVASNPPGVDPPTTAPSCQNSSCTEAPGPEPWVEIDGPSSVARGEQAGFVLEYGGFREDPQFGWSIGADGVTGVQAWNSPGEKTIYVTGATEDRVARDNHAVTVTENQQPKVDIQVPDKLHSGQQITLTAQASDPDGRIVSVEWVNGPRIIIPRGNNEKAVTVIVSDNDGGKAKEKVLIRGETVRALKYPSTARHTLYCYYTQESQRKRQNPNHCEMDGSDNSDDRDGYQSVTSNLARALESPHYNVVWKKTDEAITQHSGDVPDDVGTRMPDVVDNDGTRLTTPTLTDDQRDAITGDAVTTSTQSFTLNGKTVSNDLNGDGVVNAADWDERYGSDDASASETHRDAVSEAKDARRATNRATGGGGPAASDSAHSDPSSDSSASSSPDTGDSNANGGSSDGGSSGPSDPLGGTLPDSLTGGSAGEHAAEKGGRIADEGLDLGVGY